MAGPRAVDIFLSFNRTKEKSCSSPGGCIALFPLCLNRTPGDWTPSLGWIESKNVMVSGFQYSILSASFMPLTS